MSLEKYFQMEESFHIDWKEFWNRINDSYSKEYKIFHSNISCNKSNATKIGG